MNIAKIAAKTKIELKNYAEFVDALAIIDKKIHKFREELHFNKQEVPRLKESGLYEKEFCRHILPLSKDECIKLCIKRKADTPVKYTKMIFSDKTLGAHANPVFGYKDFNFYKKIRSKIGTHKKFKQEEGWKKTKSLVKELLSK